MKKRRIFLSFIASILVFTGLLLVGCGDLGNAQDTFALYSQAMTNYKSNTNLFISRSINNNQTNFYLNNFYSKNAIGEEVQDDQNYLILTAIGLNFIEEYHTKLDGLEGSYDFNNLVNAINKLNTDYDELKLENEKMLSVESNAEVDIYNGYFTRYKNSARNFIDEVYETALTLGNFLMNNARIARNLGSETQTQDELNFYYDYQLLQIFNDFRLILMDSASGQILTDTVYTNSSSKLKNFAQNIQAKSVKQLTVEQTNSYIEICEALNNERISYQKAVNAFSLEEFENMYDSYLEAYTRVNSNFDSYYNQLNNYFCETNNIMTLIYNYYTSNIVA